MPDTIQDQLAAALKEEPAATPAEKPAEATAAPVTETAEQAAERLRDEKGRFAAGKSGKGGTDGEPPVGVEAAQLPKPRPPRPSTWKKDYWDHWEKLDPTLAEYLVQREGEYAKGVSTYKTEWENARPLIDAIAPFQPILQQHGIQPAAWIQSLGQAQQVLALGTQQQKIDMLRRVASQYQIPLQSLIQEAGGEQPAQAYDPRVDQLQQQLQQFHGQWNAFQTEQQRAAQAAVDAEITKFSQDPQYKHFEQVRDKMAGLLQAGLANDLKSAYEQAIRLHDDIWQAEQQARQEADEKARREKAAEAARNAKSAAASTRSATPSAGVPKGGGAKDLRSQLAESLDAAVGGRL